MFQISLLRLILEVLVRFSSNRCLELFLWYLLLLKSRYICVLIITPRFVIVFPSQPFLGVEILIMSERPIPNGFTIIMLQLSRYYWSSRCIEFVLLSAADYSANKAVNYNRTTNAFTWSIL